MPLGAVLENLRPQVVSVKSLAVLAADLDQSAQKIIKEPPVHFDVAGCEERCFLGIPLPAFFSVEVGKIGLK